MKFTNEMKNYVRKIVSDSYAQELEIIQNKIAAYNNIINEAKEKAFSVFADYIIDNGADKDVVKNMRPSDIFNFGYRHGTSELFSEVKDLDRQIGETYRKINERIDEIIAILSFEKAKKDGPSFAESIVNILNELNSK